MRCIYGKMPITITNVNTLNYMYYAVISNQYTYLDVLLTILKLYNTCIYMYYHIIID